DQRRHRDLRRGAPDRLREVRTLTDMPKRPPGGRTLREITSNGRRGRPVRLGSAVLGEELHHVVEAEATIAPLADAVERKLAAIPESFHGIHVEVEHLGDFGRREHRPQLVHGHRAHMVVAFLYARMSSAPEGWRG